MGDAAITCGEYVALVVYRRLWDFEMTVRIVLSSAGVVL